MDNKEKLSVINECIDILAGIKEDHAVIENSLKEILEPFGSVWDGKAGTALVDAIGSVRDDSSGIRSSIDRTLSLLETEKLSAKNTDNIGDNNETVSDAICRFPKGV